MKTLIKIISCIFVVVGLIACSSSPTGSEYNEGTRLGDDLREYTIVPNKNFFRYLDRVENRGPESIDVKIVWILDVIWFRGYQVLPNIDMDYQIQCGEYLKEGVEVVKIRSSDNMNHIESFFTLDITHEEYHDCQFTIKEIKIHDKSNPYDFVNWSGSFTFEIGNGEWEFPTIGD